MVEHHLSLMEVAKFTGTLKTVSMPIPLKRYLSLRLNGFEPPPPLKIISWINILFSLLSLEPRDLSVSQVISVLRYTKLSTEFFSLPRPRKVRRKK